MSGKDRDVKTTYTVPDVVGHVDKAAIVSHLKANCGDGLRMTDVYSVPRAAIAERRRYLQIIGMLIPLHDTCRG
jgi:hypothetical protein